MESDTDTSYPLEYNVFALAFKQEGAIRYFSENLDPESVGIVNGQTGLNQFYLTLLDFYHKTGLDPVDPIAFQTWLEDSAIYAALGGYGGVSVFIDTVMSVDLSTPESVAKTLTYRANKRKQIEHFQELQSLIQDKELKTETDRYKIQELTEAIRSIENDMGYDPYENVHTGVEIASRAESLWELPDFVPTQFKSLNAAMGYSEVTGGFVKGAVHAILAVSGAGKPLSVDTQVLMGDGNYKRLGNIQVGDYVISHTGTPRKVTDVYDQGVLDTVDIETTQGRSVKSALDHTFMTDRGWLEAQQLQIGDLLYSPVNPRVFDFRSDLPMFYREADKIADIVSGEPAFCRCITVEVDHTFIANDIIVHNSTLAKSLVNYWVDEGHKVLYINYEEAIAHWERVLFSQVTKQNVYHAAQLSETEKKHYTKVFRDKMEEWGDRFMVKHDPDTPYFDDLEKWLMDIASHGPASSPDVVVIDTIQSMFMKGSGGKPRWGEFEEMMVRLERIAKKMHTVLIITAQENNNRIKDRREVVQQSDVGGSVTIVQKSSFTIFITQKKLISGDDSEDERIMQLQIPKNRITGDSSSLDPPLVRYNDTIKTYEPYDVPSDDLYEGHVVTVEDIGELA